MKYILDFEFFANTSPQQRFTPPNPNYTGQAYHATQGTDLGTYTQNQDLSAEMKTFYDKALIKLYAPHLIHDQFGQKRPIPGRNGKTIEFRKFNPLPAVPADLELVEGVTPTGQNYGVTAITATVKQYGGYVTISDMLNLTAIDNQMLEVVEILADQAGLVSDKVTRDEIVKGTNVQYAGNATGRVDGTGVTGLTSSDTLKIEDIKKAVRTLKRVDAKPFEGGFVAIVHPDVVFDLMNDSEWIDANQYAGSQKLFDGEIGKMYGVRFVESTNAKIWVTAGGLPVYATLVIGKNAYGVTSINGGGIETIMKQKGSAGTADPLDQRSTAGWKLNKTARILTETYMVRIESAASFGSGAVAN